MNPSVTSGGPSAYSRKRLPSAGQNSMVLGIREHGFPHRSHCEYHHQLKIASFVTPDLAYAEAKMQYLDCL